MSNRLTERVELPDGTFMEGPLLGSQMPRLYNIPERHEQLTDGCTMCQLEREEERHDHGCGDHVGLEVLEWAEGVGYILDPWQKWAIRHMFGRQPNGLWSAPDVVMIVARQNGKGREALTNKVYTRRGWTTFMEIQPGDEVLGSDGKFTRVTGRSAIIADAPCYEVGFTDGSKVKVSDTHLWHVKNKNKGLWRNVSTEELAKSVGARRPDNGRMEYNWRVRCDATPELPDADLPVDPYLLGYWLGDGNSHAARMTIGTEDLRWSTNRLEQAGAACAEPKLKGGESTAYDVAFRTEIVRSRQGFLPVIRSLNLLGNKHIPEAYLTASIAQRKALLAGLMDSDGGIQANNKTPQCEFSTSIPALAEGFHRLARSLGIRTSPKWRKTKKKDNCRFLFTAPFNPFEMPRKAAAWKAPASNRHELMSIVSVTPVESVPTRCIKVAAEDGVYLTGELFTPTHNTVLEVRELAGIFLLREELIIHTSHQLKTSLNHLERLSNTIRSYHGLEKQVSNIVTGNGKEAIKLKPKPTLIFGPGGKEITARRSSKIEFHARSGSATSRGFSCDCLVYDEAMILSNEQVGASMPTMRARPNPQMIYAASAGLEDGTVSQQLALMRQLMVKGDPQTFGLEFSINSHDESCPKDEIRGRKSNNYIICDKHDDRDDPRSWAKANPAMGERVTLTTTRRELAKMPPKKFDIEILSVGNWPSDEEPWAVISKPAWKILTNEDPGFYTPPMVVAFDVEEGGLSATVTCAWEHKQRKTVIEMPRNGSRQGTSWVIPFLVEKCKKWKPLAIAIPKAGAAAGLIDDAVRQWGDRVYQVGPGEEAAAFALFIQQVKDEQLWHFGEKMAPTLWKAVGRADTRVMGDGGNAWCRRDSETDISPVTSATIAAYVLNKRRRNYDLSNTVA